MALSATYPAQILRRHSTNFEAALSVCLADPQERAVHKLRTESRRLEAQIALLLAMKDLPPFRAEVRKAQWQIRKIRQAAGRVRDLDVQSGHLEDYAKKVRAGSLSDATKQQALADLETMLTTRATRRVKAAEKLAKEIVARQVKVSAALEKLNQALTPADHLSLPSVELLGIAKDAFERSRAAMKKHPSADDLHTVRKAGKQARYLAENAGTKAAVKAAKEFEHVQELGGEWHDWLDLAVAARKELGKKHMIAGEFAALRDENLERFRSALKTFGGVQAAAPHPSVNKTSQRLKSIKTDAALAADIEMSSATSGFSRRDGAVNAAPSVPEGEQPRGGPVKRARAVRR